MIFKTITPIQKRKEKSRRDGILLTVECYPYGTYRKIFSHL